MTECLCLFRAICFWRTFFKLKVVFVRNVFSFKISYPTHQIQMHWDCRSDQPASQRINAWRWGGTQKSTFNPEGVLYKSKGSTKNHFHPKNLFGRKSSSRIVGSMDVQTSSLSNIQMFTHFSKRNSYYRSRTFSNGNKPKNPVWVELVLLFLRVYLHVPFPGLPDKCHTFSTTPASETYVYMYTMSMQETRIRLIYWTGSLVRRLLCYLTAWHSEWHINSLHHTKAS